MANKFDQKSVSFYLTPSTRKLMQMREGKGPGILNCEEIELLRMSKREISIGSRIARQAMIENADKLAYVSTLSNKTSYLATLEEIENAIQDGWAQGELNTKE